MVKIHQWYDYKKKCAPYYIWGHGVFHNGEEKIAMATDGHAILISKPDYKEEYAGKVVDFNEQELNLSIPYPDYHRVVYQNKFPVDIDRERIKRLLKETKGAHDYLNRFAIKVVMYGPLSNPICLDPYLCKLLLTLPKEGKFYFRCANTSSSCERTLLEYISDDGNYKAYFTPNNHFELDEGGDFLVSYIYNPNL